MAGRAKREPPPSPRVSGCQTLSPIRLAGAVPCPAAFAGAGAGAFPEAQLSQDALRAGPTAAGSGAGKISGCEVAAALPAGCDRSEEPDRAGQPAAGRIGGPQASSTGAFA